MKKFGAVTILILIIVALGAGFWFKEDLLKFLKFASWQINNGIGEFKKTDIGSLMSEVKKEILTPAPLNIGGASNNVVLFKSKIILETNLQRKANGLSELVENNLLSESALAKANDMFLNQYFEHTSPGGVSSGDLVQSYGYEYIVTGENLILGNFEDETELVQAWMDSPGHRANILNTRYKEIGVSIVKGTYEGQTVWISVQEFGLPLSECSEPDDNLRDQIEIKKIELDQLGFSIDEKKAEIDKTNPNSAHYNQMINDYNQLVQSYNNLAEELKKDISQYNNQVNIFNKCVGAN